MKKTLALLLSALFLLLAACGEAAAPVEVDLPDAEPEETAPPETAYPHPEVELPVSTPEAEKTEEPEETLPAGELEPAGSRLTADSYVIRAIVDIIEGNMEGTTCTFDENEQALYIVTPMDMSRDNLLMLWNSDPGTVSEAFDSYESMCAAAATGLAAYDVILDAKMMGNDNRELMWIVNDTRVFDITAVSPLPEYSSSNSFISSVSDVIRESGFTCEFSVSRQSLDVVYYLDSSYAEFIGKRGSGDVDESTEALVQSMLEANTVTYEGFIDAGMYGVSTTLMMYDSGGVPLALCVNGELIFNRMT